MATQSQPPIVNDPRTYEIIGAAMEVHRELGPGFAEPVYQAALTKELAQRDIPFAREVPMRVEYKGDRLEVKYCADFVCYDGIIVELKALPEITGWQYAQVRNYLHVSRKELGLILNFGCKKLQYRRVEPSQPKAKKKVLEEIKKPYLLHHQKHLPNLLLRSRYHVSRVNPVLSRMMIPPATTAGMAQISLSPTS